MKYYKIVFKIIKDCFRIDKMNYERAEVLTVAHDIDRSYLYKGKYYAPLINTIEDDLMERGVSSVSFARIISEIKGDKSHGTVYSPEGSFARALISKKISSFFRKEKYPYSKAEEKVWSKIIAKVQPKHILAIMPSRELCKVAHEKGIWVADVQHGIIADEHPWYGWRFRSDEPNHVLPDSFMVWDMGSKMVLEKWTKKKNIDINVVGNRWLQRFKKMNQSDELVNECESEYAQKFDKGEEKTRILVSLSWGFTTQIKNGIISDEIIELILNTHNHISWQLRLHPNQVKGFATEESKAFFEIFDKKLKDKCEWEITTYSPLPVVLKNIDLHIAWDSSVAIEAAQLGIKSALLNPELRSEDDLRFNYYFFYKEKGFVSYIEDDYDAINEWIQNNKIEAKQLAYKDEKLFDKNYSEFLNFISIGNN